MLNNRITKSNYNVLVFCIIFCTFIGCNNPNETASSPATGSMQPSNTNNKDNNFVYDASWRDKVTEEDGKVCLKNMQEIVTSVYMGQTDGANSLVALAANIYLELRNGKLRNGIGIQFLEAVKNQTKNAEDIIYRYSEGKYKCSFDDNYSFYIAGYQLLKNSTSKNQKILLEHDIGSDVLAVVSIVGPYLVCYKFIEKEGYPHSTLVGFSDIYHNYVELPSAPSPTTGSMQPSNTNNVAQAAPIPPQMPTPSAVQTPKPAPVDINDNTYKGKRCDIQTISNEKHLPNWNIEIFDSTVIASMLKDAEKAHLPFIKINASDDLKQKLEDYINKNPSKLNIAPSETISCELGQYIKTQSNIGIQHVLCSDSENSIAFLNLVSPIDNKARVYKTKTFDHLFEDAPVITQKEEIVLNGERGAYVAVKYEIASDGTGTEHVETDIMHHLFLGDKLRYLTDWNAFHIEENSEYAEEDGKENYSCNAKATVLRLESTGSKEMTHTFAIGE